MQAVKPKRECNQIRDRADRVFSVFNLTSIWNEKRKQTVHPQWISIMYSSSVFSRICLTLKRVYKWQHGGKSSTHISGSRPFCHELSWNATIQTCLCLSTATTALWKACNTLHSQTQTATWIDVKRCYHKHFNLFEASKACLNMSEHAAELL